MPNFSLKLYNNIAVPNWVDFDLPPGPKRGMVEADFRISNKVSLIWASSPSYLFWNAYKNIASMEVLSRK